MGDQSDWSVTVNNNDIIVDSSNLIGPLPLSNSRYSMVLQISLAFENCVGYCACFVLQFYTVVMRVKGHTQNSMFKRK